MVDEDMELVDSVQRLHRYVVDALRVRRGDAFASPVTVAEIYQELAPYRTVRSVLGFEMNADYEHALLRMLSGIDGLTRIDPATASERMKKELVSPNPDVTLYRDYAGCDVVLNPSDHHADWVREQLDDDEPRTVTKNARSLDAPDWSALADLSGSSHLKEEETEDAEEPDATDDTGTPAPPVETRAVFELETNTPRATHEDVALKGVSQTERCEHCDSQLPRGRSLRFCPFCGSDQSERPCGACGQLVERGWSFCISCGTHVA
ncbi:MAG: zinc ribbon domain-containing protein [Longimicrobiales bacterium]